MIRTAKVIDPSAAGDGIALFDTVTFRAEDDDEEETIQLVTTLRQDALRGLISKESPVGRALLGHRAGDRVRIDVREGVSYDVTIVKVEKSTGDPTDIPISPY